MRSSDDRTIPPFRNVFTLSFLERLGERDEPPTAGEADVAGPWHVEEISRTRFGVFHSGESAARGFRPYAVFTSRPLALLAASLLPGTGRAAFHLQKKAGFLGFAVTESGEEVAGHLQLFDEKLVDALNVLDALLRSPEALAGVLEAAGAVALERVGVILEERFLG
ncbi:MAG TPA: hypothetical protein VMW27_13875 [Thermoanaerobaculia bacterium]|nr:hypothetical protein [Thermoanaerobaculia bacterium]